MIQEYIGQFFISNIGLLTNYNAHADYKFEFKYASYEDKDGLGYKYLSVTYDYNNDAFTIVLIDNDGITTTLTSVVDFEGMFNTSLGGSAFITFTSDPDDADMFLNIQQEPNTNVIFGFRLNSEKNVINKSLIFVTNYSGQFRNQINIKTPVVSIENYKIENTINYVYISSLKRYYYVDSIDLLKNVIALTLSEDVLMSHKDLILSQTAFIERQENEFSPDVVDNNYILDYQPDITFTELTFAEYNIFNFSISSSTYGSYVITVVSTLP